MESYVMTVTCRPTLSAVARIVSVLHARRAEITDLHYRDGALRLGVCGDDAELLSAQLRRVVDVLSVCVSARRPVVVAS